MFGSSYTSHYNKSVQISCIKLVSCSNYDSQMIIIIICCEHFPYTLANGLSFGSECQQVFSALQYSFQCGNLDRLESSFDFQLFQPISQVFMLYFRCSPLVHLFPSLPVPLPVVTVSSAPKTIRITVTFMFHSFLVL